MQKIVRVQIKKEYWEMALLRGTLKTTYVKCLLKMCEVISEFISDFI
jgi:hypothetical protein